MATTSELVITPVVFGQWQLAMLNKMNFPQTPVIKIPKMKTILSPINQGLISNIGNDKMERQINNAVNFFSMPTEQFSNRLLSVICIFLVILTLSCFSPGFCAHKT